MQKTKNRSISTLSPGEHVTLRFHGSKQFGNEPYEMSAVFTAFNADKNRATFSLDHGEDDFEAYKYVNRWAYGTSAEKITVVPA
jgi:hypothetical protein